MKYIYLALTLVTAGCVSNAPTNTNSVRVASATQVHTSPDATTAFVAACVNSTSAPNTAASALVAQGFKQKGSRRGRLEFESPHATASVSQGANGNLGQCSVTPKHGSFATSVTTLRSQIASSALPAVKLPGDEAWLIGSSGSIVLVSREKGAMVRSQPNVY